ncbi:MAG TPA: putative Fe-S cluster assembly protein SufT [Myxococcales bacterium]|nr:putative Fe-S cluster assembly protein SufT [Myxococcales bacterium]
MANLPVVEVVEAPPERGGPITLARDCEATRIPSGSTVVLPAGTRVTITQSLGGQFTVNTEDGALLRIADKDADALGERAPAIQAPMTEGPFEEERVWEELRTVFDPEIPVNLVDLGLIYRCNAVPLPDGSYRVEISMSMTAPGCGMGDVLKEDVRRKVQGVPGVREVQVDVVWDPPWDASRMSDAARLQLGWM